MYARMLSLFVAALAVCTPALVMAQGEAVGVDKIIDFGGVVEELQQVAVPIIVAAVTFGLSIWGVKFLFRLIKSFARG